MFSKTSTTFRRIVATIMVVFAVATGVGGFTHWRTISRLHAEGDRITEETLAVHANRVVELQQLVYTMQDQGNEDIA